MKKEIVCNCVEDTEKTGFETARFVSENSITFVALYGGLGAGKTAFVRGFTSFHDKNAVVMSPTYNLVNVYGNIYHFDMYRITNEDDLYSIGFFDYDDGKNIILTEWSENIEYALPDIYLKVVINKSDDCADKRVIILETVGF
ncbi:MAG: tRNA (adenosine(37)-N6)-threonylcarbamoyltransferase complex ATPase subunit type 1 TsaE [Ruminococcaceae bacterium]|nr:tRNA (adenosine(37)-N6)-threonylcarbamoyltransferase complex ATPase subunit type 1 TsaE [Oscillospiraceae bacterium]